MLYPVISIRQPWAALILTKQKDVENRSWRLPEAYMGVPVLVHASKRPATSPEEINRELTKRGMKPLPLAVRQLTFTGCILGAVIFRGYLPNDGQPFSEWCDRDAAYWWMIQKARFFFRPLHVKGHLGFWRYNYPKDVGLL